MLRLVPHNDLSTCILPNVATEADHQQSKPELRQLVHYSDKIVTCWKEVALELSLSTHEVDRINVDHSSVNKKCYDTFNTWLRQTCDPCWCQVANAFKTVGLNEVAREIKEIFGRWIN